MILLDTHALVWSLMAPEYLSVKARQAIQDASSWAISSATIYEIRYKHAIRKWPEVEPIARDGLEKRLKDLGFDIQAADGEIIDLAGGAKWPHRDPFDRIIVSTSVLRNLPLVSKDDTLDTFPGQGARRIW